MSVRGRKAVRPTDKRLAANRGPRMHEKTRMQQLIDGDISVEDLDDEEILRGRVKNKAGTFGGRQREMLPRKILDAIRHEMLKRLQDKFDEAASTGYEVLLEIAKNPRASADARHKSAVYLIERAMGKVPDKVAMQVEVKPYEEDLAGIMIDAASPEVVQGSVVPINKKRSAG